MLIGRHALWRLRATHEAPRYVLAATAAVGLIASARLAIAPPRPARSGAPALRAPSNDPAAEGFATLFARRYLSWNAAEPQVSARALEQFTGAGIEPAAGLQLPSAGAQQVVWAEVVQQRDVGPGERVFTVAVQTDTAGLVYLTVDVVRGTDGAMRLGAYPALVGAPRAAQAQAGPRLEEVTDSALSTVVERALRNYLANAPGELAADLTSGARVSLPVLGLRLESLDRLSWAPQRSSVVAVVRAQDPRGVRYTLAYELDVALRQGRWEISAVQMDPDA